MSHLCLISDLHIFFFFLFVFILPGGDFFVYQGVVYFTNFSDQALYKQTSPDAAPVAVTDTSKAYRYANGSFDPKVMNFQKSALKCNKFLL